MLDVFLRVVEEVIGNDLAFVVLDFPVTPDGLHPNANVHQLAVDAPVVALLLVADPHGYQVGLARAELAEDDHARPGGIYLGLLLEDLLCAPGIVDPDGGVSVAGKSGCSLSGRDQLRGRVRCTDLPIQNVISGVLYFLESSSKYIHGLLSGNRKVLPMIGSGKGPGGILDLRYSMWA